MPTTLKRTTITHTPPIARAMEVAALRWPDEPDSALAANLIVAGAEAVDNAQAEWERTVESVAEKLAKLNAGLFPECSEFLEQNRSEWPA